MSDNSKKALKQFEILLDMDEEWFRKELDSAKRMIGQNPEQPAPAPRTAAPAKAAPVRNYANGYGQAASQKAQPKEAPAPKGVGGLLILAIVEALGILALGAYWALVLLR